MYTAQANGFTFIKLLLDDRAQDRVSLVVQKETAEYFGWDKAFPEWRPRTQLRPDGTPRKYVWSTARTKHFRGGDCLRICRAASTDGHPKGKTHRFRLLGGWSRKHLVALAEVAGDKFEWMESANHSRMNRDYWLSLTPIR